MSNQVYIHIGLMKTGTTYLQQTIFPSLNLIYLRDFRDFKQDFNDKSVLYSNEGLGGSVYHPRDKRGMYYSFKQALSNIQKLIPNAKIIVCFREPSSFLLSSYKQYLHEGGTLKFEDFFNLKGTALVNPDDLIFSNYVKHLKKSFSIEELFIYDYDSFKNDREYVLKDLFSFLGLENNSIINRDKRKKGNPSVPLLYEPVLRKLNAVNSFLKERIGIGLKFHLFGKILNPRVFCQYLLPKIYRPKKERSVVSIQKHYKNDWKLLKESISN
ncbi:sulfotransferase domain-containing protein [Salibacter halophilus]|uniref:Sulfotransferase domain-containing protein n=1 Tax=Salibacter halophilus TaxID=1803916 RepID=A0A6N6M6F4_9FLAO|nr:sulfotransferase domain-containing protein [Salibacter halophilus]KAB1063528.1 sulfotransferase domain-containing protein [Salibacter halophilus]